MSNVTKRYLLFAGPDYYPAGGWRDLMGDYDDPVPAVAEGKRLRKSRSMYRTDWWEVIDLETGEEIDKAGFK